MIYLYAITRHNDHPLPNRSGLKGHFIEKVHIGEVDAVVSVCEKIRETPSSDVLWRHEAVIEALMRNQCVLPVRYGVCMEGIQELEQFVQHEEGSLLADLDRLDGCVEISLRVINPNYKGHIKRDPTLSDNNASNKERGRLFLMNRLSKINAQRDEQKRLEHWVDAVHKTLLERALDGTFQIHTHPLLMTSGAYLVRKEELHGFQKQVGQIREIHKEYKFLCTGPWPPYNFVTPTHLGIVVN